MSLVAYASSDDDSEAEVSSNQEISSSIPKKREPVKISIPSLKEFTEEIKEEPVKKIKPKTGSGLFSLLPPPKNSGVISAPGFKPYIFSKKKEVDTVSNVPDKKCTKPALIMDSFAESNNSITDKSDDTSETFDFFSLQSNGVTEIKKDLKEDPIEFNISPCTSSFVTETSVNSSETLSHAKTSIPAEDTVSGANYYANNFTESTLPSYDNLNPDFNSDPTSSSTGEASSADFTKDEGFLKLKGRRGMEEINIIDVKADEQLADREEWLLKSITQEQTHRPSKRKHNMPTSQQKRKHQITYLAFQAKEREMDLKNQWAMNSLTKRETQAKYGF